MVSLMVFPASSFANAFFIQWAPAFVIGAIAVSAMLSGWLRQRPRIQKYVTALAMASLLALSIYTAAHPKPATVKTAPVLDCAMFWWDMACWF